MPAFHNSRFPLKISYGTRGGPGYNTAVTRLGSGQEERIARWTSPIYTYNVVYGIKTRDDMHDLVHFYHARGGSYASFRFFDFADHTTAANGRNDPTALDVTIGVGDGVTTTFQLFKIYTEGNETRTRNITKPIHAETLGNPVSKTYNVLVSLDNVATASGWTVNTQTGVILFSSAPAADVIIKAGCAFDVPVRFGEELDAEMQPSFKDFDVDDLESITLLEDRPTLPVYEEVNYGGAIDHGSLIGNIEINTLQGRVHTFASNTTARRIILPDETDLPAGGPYFFIVNLGDTTSSIWSAGEVANLGSIAANQMVIVVLGLVGSTKTWLIA